MESRELGAIILFEHAICSDRDIRSRHVIAKTTKHLSLLLGKFSALICFGWYKHTQVVIRHKSHASCERVWLGSLACVWELFVTAEVCPENGLSNKRRGKYSYPRMYLWVWAYNINFRCEEIWLLFLQERTVQLSPSSVVSKFTMYSLYQTT